MFMRSDLDLHSLQNFLGRVWQPKGLHSILFQSSPCPTYLQYKSFGNTVGKGETAHNEQSLLFHSVFYEIREISPIFITFKIVV